MKKILFIAYTMTNGGGAESLLSSYVNAIDKNKFSVSIFEIERFNVKTEYLDEDITIKNIPLFSKKKNIFRIAELFNRHFLYKNPSVLKTIFNLDVYDIVISWNYQLPSFMLPAFQNSVKIAWFHGAIYDLELTDINMTQNKMLYFFHSLQKKAWGVADAIITISNNSFKSLNAVFPEYTSKASVIPNGCSPQLIVQKSKEMESLQLSKQFKYLVCIGRVDKNKNFALAIKSLALIKKIRNDIKLVIIGDGELKQEYKTLCDSLGLMDDVIFTGYKTNPFPIVKQCSLLCMTSYSEGFPMIIMECMSLGIPFITTKVSGASDELYNNGKCGVIADWDEKDYSKKILELFDDKKLYENMKQKCLEHVENFTVKKALSRLYSILDNKTGKNSLKKVSRCEKLRNRIHYFLFGLFGFDINFITRMFKINPLKTIFYLILNLISICFFPLKAIYILVYMILAGR